MTFCLPGWSYTICGCIRDPLCPRALDARCRAFGWKINELVSLAAIVVSLSVQLILWINLWFATSFAIYQQLYQYPFDLTIYLSRFILHLRVHPCYPRYAQAHASPAPRSSSADAPWPSPRCPRARRGAPYRRPPRHLERCGDGGRWRKCGRYFCEPDFLKHGGLWGFQKWDTSIY